MKLIDATRKVRRHSSRKGALNHASQVHGSMEKVAFDGSVFQQRLAAHNHAQYSENGAFRLFCSLPSDSQRTFAQYLFGSE